MILTKTKILKRKGIINDRQESLINLNIKAYEHAIVWIKNGKARVLDSGELYKVFE